MFSLVIGFSPAARLWSTPSFVFFDRRPFAVSAKTAFLVFERGGFLASTLWSGVGLSGSLAPRAKLFRLFPSVSPTPCALVTRGPPPPPPSWTSLVGLVRFSLFPDGCPLLFLPRSLFCQSHSPGRVMQCYALPSFKFAQSDCIAPWVCLVLLLQPSRTLRFIDTRPSFPPPTNPPFSLSSSSRMYGGSKFSGVPS